MRDSFLLLVLLPLSLMSQSLPWPDQSPFQDSFGYSWQTSSASDGPVFDWIEIVGLGEKVEGLGDENVVGPFSLGMNFPYYWQQYDQIWIGANGFASFDSGIPISPTSDGFPLLPNLSLPNDILAPFLADLTEGSLGEVWLYCDSINHRCIISWIDWPYFSSQAAGYSGANSFQMILSGSDSSIVFQYLSMNGNWDPAYDQLPYPFVVGIENHVGNMGLMPTGVPITSSLLPVDSTSIRFLRPATPRIPIVDLAIEWVENPGSQAVFLPWSPKSSPFWRPAHQLSAQVKNVGLVSIQQTLEVKSWVKDQQGNVLFSRQKSLPSLAAGSERFLLYYDHFDPPVAGTYLQQSYIEASNAYGDLYIGNDSMNAELIFLDTTQAEHLLSYEQSDASTPLFLFEGKGAGVCFEPYGYPADVKSLEFNLFLSQGASPNSGFFARIYARNSQQLPGSLLFEQEIPLSEVVLPSGWTRIELPQPIRIDSGGFFVAWEPINEGLRLLTDRSPPLARRSFEMEGGIWKEAVSRYREDLMIRALVDHSEAVATVPIEYRGASVSWEIFPNPVREQLQIQASFSRAAQVELELRDMVGKSIRIEKFASVTHIQHTWDIQELTVGMYLICLKTEGKKWYQKIVVRN